MPVLNGFKITKDHYDFKKYFQFKMFIMDILLSTICLIQKTFAKKVERLIMQIIYS